MTQVNERFLADNYAIVNFGKKKKKNS